MFVADLKIIEKANSLSKFSISELQNIQMILKNIKVIMLPLQNRRIFVYLVEDVRLKAFSYFVDVSETEAVLAVWV